MKIKVFAVIDTNVVVSSIISESGFPAQVIGLIEKGNIIPIFDERMLDEYYKVLNYSKFEGRISEQSKYEALYTIVNNGILFNDVEQVKIELRDKDNVPFFEVKEITDEPDSYLVTGNIKDFPVTPQVMILIMYQFDKLLERMEKQRNYETDYNQSIEELIKQQIAASKYTYGKEQINKIFDSNTQTIKKSFFEKD